MERGLARSHMYKYVVEPVKSLQNQNRGNETIFYKAVHCGLEDAILYGFTGYIV
jgi:hypothetical protein